jgi:hypothetical protein
MKKWKTWADHDSNEIETEVRSTRQVGFPEFYQLFNKLISTLPELCQEKWRTGNSCMTAMPWYQKQIRVQPKNPQVNVPGEDKCKNLQQILANQFQELTAKIICCYNKSMCYILNGEILHQMERVSTLSSWTKHGCLI